MNFDFSSEQLQMRDQARRFLTAKCPRATVRRALEGGGHDTALWSEFAGMGFLGVTVPERFGGLGLGALDLCVLAEEVGRALAPVPFASSVCLAGDLLNEAGSEPQRAQWLSRLADGSAIAAFALAEIAGTVSRQSIATTFADGLLSGGKIAVRGADVADIAIVVARAGDAIVPCLVELNQAGVTRTIVRTLDPALGHANLAFAQVAAEPLGAADWLSVRRALDRAAILMAFEQLGGAERALEMARDHALERMAFGRRLGSFQAIKHMLADMYVLVELARANCWFGAWALGADAPELVEAAASARLCASEAYRHCAKNAIQVHGGMGFTWESDCHLHYRRANLLALALGPQAEWEDRLIDALVAKREARP